MWSDGGVADQVVLLAFMTGRAFQKATIRSNINSDECVPVQVVSNTPTLSCSTE